MRYIRLEGTTKNCTDSKLTHAYTLTDIRSMKDIDYSAVPEPSWSDAVME